MDGKTVQGLRARRDALESALRDLDARRDKLDAERRRVLGELLDARQQVLRAELTAGVDPT